MSDETKWSDELRLLMRLLSCQDCADEELAHADADGYLLDYIEAKAGPEAGKQIREAFDGIQKWYG